MKVIQGHRLGVPLSIGEFFSMCEICILKYMLASDRLSFPARLTLRCSPSLSPKAESVPLQTPLRSTRKLFCFLFSKVSGLLIRCL